VTPNYVDMIASIKCSSFEYAHECALPIVSDDDVKIGSLIPVGPWILNDREKIQSICDWRQKAMRFFLTQFESTYDRTHVYLKNLSIEQEGRIFFLIYNDEDEFIGHIGLANIDGRTGELDNLMRGKSGGDTQLIYFAEKTILSWAFNDLNLSHMSLRIISFNVLTINLHAEFGFEVVEKYPLLRSEEDGFITHEPVEKAKTNVRYTSVLMEMKKEQFKDSRCHDNIEALVYGTSIANTTSTDHWFKSPG